MQTKNESHTVIRGSRLVSVHEDAIKDGIFNCPDEVTIIGENAFDFHRQLITVVNLNKVKYIETLAFSNCPNLITVNAPEVEKIGENGFSDCTKLIRVDLPKVKILCSFAFYNCASLKSIHAPQVEKLNNCAFANCQTLATIDLPKVTTMHWAAFQNCLSLTVVNLPQIEFISNEVFEGCGESVTLNLSKVKNLARYTFLNCTAATTLILHPAVRVYFQAWELTDSDSDYKRGNLKQIIINNLDETRFNKKAITSQLPSPFNEVEIILASEVIENLCYIQKVLKQHIALKDIEREISSFYLPLFFSGKSVPLQTVQKTEEDHYKFIENLYYIQKILKQYITLKDIERQISSFYPPLFFSGKTMQDTKEDDYVDLAVSYPSCSIM